MPRGPSPTPGSRSEGSFDWVQLPVAGRKGAAPKLPARKPTWSAATRAWWTQLWKSPQAAAWDQTGRTLWRLAELHQLKADCRAGIDDAEKLAAKLCSIDAQMTALEDRHGLNPKALMQLRWVITAAEVARPAAKPADDLAKKRAERRKQIAG